jgi:hypothetical protein
MTIPNLLIATDAFVLGEVSFAIAGAVVLVVVLLALGGAWLWHRSQIKAAQREAEAFKQQVMQLSDKIDALKERHKMLPHLDKDYSAPMQGATLAAYNRIATQLEGHRQGWLKLMEVWEQADKLLQSQSFFGSGQARQARQLLFAAAAPKANELLLQECEAPLDQLQSAHEQVISQFKLIDQEQQRLVKQREAIAAATLSIAAYERPVAAIAALVQTAHGFGPGDPLGALSSLGEAQQQLAQLHHKAAKTLELVKTARDAAERVQKADQNAAQRRSQGYSLREQEANPDPLLAEARQQHALAWQALNQADEMAAEAGLKKTLALAEQAHQAVEQHVAAKVRCESELPRLRNEARRLTDLQTAAQGQQAELARDFAPESWSAVAQNLNTAVTQLGSSQRLLQEAARAATQEVQQYCLASRLVTEAAESCKQVEATLAAIGKRLGELVEARKTCRAQLAELRNFGDRVGRLLQSSSADRLQANEQYRAAATALERLEGDARMQRADWTRLATRAREIQTDFEKAEKTAREDFKLADQATNEISEAERAIRHARTFDEFGFEADVSAAKRHLAEAERRLQSQEYEEAIRAADHAERDARRALDEVKAKADRQREELEAHRPAAAAQSLMAAPQPVLQAEADEPQRSTQREC